MIWLFDVHRFAWGMLSPESAALIKERIADLLDTFDTRTRSDEVRARTSHSGTCLLVAMRDWEPSGFEALRR